MRRSFAAGLAFIALGLVLQCVSALSSRPAETPTRQDAPLIAAPAAAERPEPKAFFDGRQAPAEAVLVRTGPPISAAQKINAAHEPVYFAGEGCPHCRGGQCLVQPVRRVAAAPVAAAKASVRVVRHAQPVRRATGPIRRLFGR